MKTAISLPDDLFRAADSLAQRLGLSRSGLYAAALEDYLVRHQAKQISERLDAVYSAEPSELEKPLVRAQGKMLKNANW